MATQEKELDSKLFILMQVASNNSLVFNNKTRFMGPMLIWQNITIVVNVVLWEILALTRERHIQSKHL